MGRGRIGFYKNRLSEVAQNEKDSKHPDRAFALLPAGRARRGAGRPRPRRAGGRRALGRAPVSYTHLDVYKRQRPWRCRRR